jgi:hypothetical protein
MNTLLGSNRWGRWAGIFLLGPFATSIPISLSFIRSNVGGSTKKATVSAMLFLAYCTGNIIGLQLFLDKEAPKYPVSGISPVVSHTWLTDCIDWATRRYCWLFPRHLLPHPALYLLRVRESTAR